MQRRLRPIAIAVVLAAVAVSAPGAVPVQAPRFAALARVEPGQWRLRDQTGAVRSLCITDPTTLFQLRHPGTLCSRFVIENSPAGVTVHYTCPGAGHGRTAIAVETPRLLRIASQGVAAGAPFDLEVEGRRIGSC